jgi:lysophospholipase L1-like esterase
MPKLTWWKSFGHDYNAATAEIAEELEVPLIDLYAHFKDRDDFFADESHFTEEGHALAAEIVLQRLQPWIRGAGGATCAP